MNIEIWQLSIGALIGPIVWQVLRMVIVFFYVVFRGIKRGVKRVLFGKLKDGFSRVNVFKSAHKVIWFEICEYVRYEFWLGARIED